MQDLSAQMPSAPLIGNSSMAATNTVSDETGSMTAPGSPSEQTVAVPARAPVQEIPPREGVRPVMVTQKMYVPAAAQWQMLPENGYSKETP
jgi:hypothetical protein